ncbi:MAG: flagellar basal body protein, partial [Clostridiaceae bacterium]
MIRALYTAVSGMKSQQAKQQVVINNLSNMDTNGYKEDNLIVKKFSDVLIENKDNLINGKSKKNIIGSLSLGTAIDEVYTKFLQGNITTTD